MHSEEKALLAAIIAHPDEDTPRLVYADWLQEHGREERAEFIRVQCAHARLRYDSAEYKRDAGRLEGRAKELKKEHEKAWIAELSLPTNRQTSFWFARGMVASVWCSARYFLSHAPALLSTTPVESIAFRQLAASNIKMLARSPHIASVLGAEFLMDYMQTELLTLYLKEVPTDALRALKLTTFFVSPRSAEWMSRNVALARAIAETPGLANLQRLDLRFAGVGEDGAKALIESRHLTRLKCLDLQENAIGKRTETALRKRFGDAVVLGEADFTRFTLAELGWD